jgi:hypothetical protein
MLIDSREGEVYSIPVRCTSTLNALVRVGTCIKFTRTRYRRSCFGGRVNEVFYANVVGLVAVGLPLHHPRSPIMCPTSRVEYKYCRMY